MSNQNNNQKLKQSDNSKLGDKKIGSTKEKKIDMVTKHFEARELLAFSQLRTLNQKELIESLDQNEKIGIVIKDKLQVAMISMEKYENIVETVHEYGRLLEWLEEHELFSRLENRLSQPVWDELPEGSSLWEKAGLDVKG